MLQNGRSKLWRISLSAFLGLGVVTGTAVAQVPEPIIFGAPFHVIDTAPVMVAWKKGYFKAEGLTIELRDVRTGTKVMEAGLAGSLNAGLTNTISFLNGAARRTGHVAVASMAILDRNHRSQQMLVRKDLVETGRVKAVTDLRGLKIAVQAWGSAPELSAVEVLRRHGVKPEEVTWVEMDFPVQGPAFAARQIDASVLPNPLLTQFIQRGFAVAPFQDPDMGGPLSPLVLLGRAWYGKDFFPNGIVWVTEEYARKSPTGVRTFVRALERAVQFIRANPAETAGIVAEVTRLDKALLAGMEWPGFDTKVYVAEMQAIADRMLELKRLDRKVNVAEVVFRP